jgi:hypothetical protein
MELMVSKHAKKSASERSPSALKSMGAESERDVSELAAIGVAGGAGECSVGGANATVAATLACEPDVLPKMVCRS